MNMVWLFSRNPAADSISRYSEQLEQLSLPSCWAQESQAAEDLFLAVGG